MKNIILWTLLAAIWGSSYLAIKLAVEDISPLILVASRMFIGSVVLLIILRLKSLSLPKDMGSWAVLVISGLFGSVIPFFLISSGELHVDSGLAALLMGIAPVVTILLAPLAHKEDKLTSHSIIGIIFGVAGLIALMGPSALQGFGSHIMGQISILGAALCYAFTTLFVRKYAKLPALVMGTGSTFIGAVIIVIIAFIFDSPIATLQNNSSSWLAVVYLGIFPTAIATWIYFYLVPKIGSARMSQINFAVPVVGSVLGIIFLNETFGINAAIALLLIMAAIYFVSKK